MGELKVIQLPEALSICADDPSLFAMVLQAVIDQLPETLGMLRDAEKGSDATALGRAYHKLKGTAANLAAEPLRARLAELEELSRSASHGDVLAKATGLDALIDDFTSDVNDLKTQYPD